MGWVRIPLQVQSQAGKYHLVTVLWICGFALLLLLDIRMSFFTSDCPEYAQYLSCTKRQTFFGMNEWAVTKVSTFTKQCVPEWGSCMCGSVGITGVPWRCEQKWRIGEPTMQANSKEKWRNVSEKIDPILEGLLHGKRIADALSKAPGVNSQLNLRKKFFLAKCSPDCL